MIRPTHSCYGKRRTELECIIIRLLRDCPEIGRVKQRRDQVLPVAFSAANNSDYSYRVLGVVEFEAMRVGLSVSLLTHSSRPRAMKDR